MQAFIYFLCSTKLGSKKIMDLYNKFAINFNKLIGCIGFSKLVISVSGGSDSVALLFLTSKWAKDNSVELIVTIVNHNLREEASKECQYIEYLCKLLQHKIKILYWNHYGNYSNLQARAREGRYNLITHFCFEINVSNMITAHHLDDNIENFYIRKQKRSSTLGLSSHNTTFYNNIRILRPLYNIEKVEIVNFLLSNNIRWFEDISNKNLKYTRNKVRLLLTYNPLLREKLIHEQAQINISAYHIKNMLIKSIAESVSINNLGFGRVNLSTLLYYSYEVVFYTINHVLIIIGGKSNTPRHYATENLVNRIIYENFFIITLHGCFIKKIKDELLFFREFGKKLPEKVFFKGVQSIMWDNRFKISLIKSSGSEKNSVELTDQNFNEYYVTNFEESDYIKIKKFLNLQTLSSIPKDNQMRVLFTLPVIKRLKKIISIAHISYYNHLSKPNEFKFKFSFWPIFTSRFTHFY